MSTGTPLDQAEISAEAHVLVRGIDDRIVSWNTGAERLYGYTSAEAVGCVTHELLKTVFPEPLESVRAKLVAAGEWQGGLIRTTRDGRLITVESHWVLCRDALGAPTGIIEVNRDVAQLSAAEGEQDRLVERLQEATSRAERSRAQLDAVFQAIGEGVLIIDMAGNFVFANEAEARTFGFSSVEEMSTRLPELLGTFELYYLDGQPIPMKDWPGYRALRGESFVDLQMRARRRDTGQEGYYSMSGGPVLDEQGTQVFAIVINRDITERKRTEDALQRSEENFRAMFDYTPAAVFAYDRQGIIIEANPACSELFDIPLDRIVGRSIFDSVARSKDQEEVTGRIGYVFSGGSVENIEWVDTRPDGTSRWILTNITPVRGPDGRVIMGLSLNVDINDRKVAEEKERRREQEKLEFYRRTISAATGDRLVLTDQPEICGIAGPHAASWEIDSPEDLGPVRDDVQEFAHNAGMDEFRAEKLVMSVGEAATNVIKHAGRGTVSIHRLPDGLMVVVADQGPGIPALALPEVALRRGYSTVGTLGMGYKVMISSADRVYLATGVDGTMVGIQMPFNPPGPRYPGIQPVWGLIDA